MPLKTSPAPVESTAVTAGAGKTSAETRSFELGCGRICGGGEVSSSVVPFGNSNLAVRAGESIESLAIPSRLIQRAPIAPRVTMTSFGPLARR